MRSFKVVLASSGLGHTTRGIETWTEELAYALKKEGVKVTLYKGGGRRKSKIEVVLSCIQRRSTLAGFLKRTLPPFSWHFGFGNEVQTEQTTFGLSLILNLLRHPVDIVHTQEPHLANLLRAAGKLGIIKSKLILAHGTNESPAFLRKFKSLQHLTPYGAKEHYTRGQKSFMITNFIDTERFQPGKPSNIRKILKIPEDAFVVLSVAAIKKEHKNIDYLLQEISTVAILDPRQNIFLIVAGGETPETPELIQMGRKLLSAKAVFLVNQPYDQMVSVYAAADLFVLPSIREMCPIAIMEALAAGLPVIASQFPSIAWLVGLGGECIDMTKKGELAKTIPKFFHREFRQSISRKAREQAVNNFAQKKVVGQIIEMYQSVLKTR